jgi:hypothetical protein
VPGDLLSQGAAGTVVAVGEPASFEGYGQIVVVDLGGGIEALYAHLATFDVEVGDEVTSGEPLGLAGCTGWCTGTHLHFELHDDGAVFDSLPLLPRPEPEGPAGDRIVRGARLAALLVTADVERVLAVGTQKEPPLCGASECRAAEVAVDLRHRAPRSSPLSAAI